jgi:single-stranded-DNA-specific exonuclease
VPAWLEPQPVVTPEAFRLAVGGHPLVAQTLLRRGFAEVDAAKAFLDPDCYQPASPFDLPNMTAAVERLETAIRGQESICVWGDFDVDGQTATTLLVSVLTGLGARVRFHIPSRQRESHGINLSVLKRVIGEGTDLVLTCDTGVAEHEAIAWAQAQGVDVVVTDHHDLPPTLPPACAIVDPKMLPEGHRLRELPGVGCAYQLAEALCTGAGRPEEAAGHLDLVALGIVADVAVQVKDTRYLLQRGLRALRRTQRLGLKAMMELAELRPDQVTEEHVAFVLAPRLNALGRLADAAPAVELLTTTDLVRARSLATQLEGLNAQRRLLCSQVAQAAQAQIECDPSLLQYGVLVLSHPSWPAGVIGIVASQLAERYGRPTVLIATPPGEPGRGSARSVEGCNITAAIGAHADLVMRYGGHPMAAGVTIDPELIPAFRRALSRTVLEQCAQEEERSIAVEAYLPLDELSLELVEELERLAPFGAGNPPLVLASRNLLLAGQRPVGRDGEHLLLTVEDETGTGRRVIWWEGAGSPLPHGRFDLAYVARASDYRGQRDVQIEWVDARVVEGPVLVPAVERPPFQIVDHRGRAHPRQLLERLRAEEDVLVWAEADARAEVDGRDRNQLRPAPALAVWTVPPGPAELRAVLGGVAPEVVYLFAIDPNLDRPDRFLRRLAGLVKHVLHAEGGQARVSALAAATAHREATVRVGLAWLAAHGLISLLPEDDAEVVLGPGDQSVDTELDQVTARLEALLEETAAYRSHFGRADGPALVRAAEEKGGRTRA